MNRTEIVEILDKIKERKDVILALQICNEKIMKMNHDAKYGDDTMDFTNYCNKIRRD